MALKDLVNAKNEIVLPRYNQWYMEHQQDPYPQWVVDLIDRELTKVSRRRVGTLSSSSAGSCLRRQIFEYLGTPSTEKLTLANKRIFDAGDWIHLKHQANLLSAGIITNIEVFLPWAKKRSFGTADGLGVVPKNHSVPEWRGKEFGLEIKSMNSYTWDYYRKKSKLSEIYQKQNDRYFLSSGWDLFVFLCENKDTGELFEIVRDRSKTNLSDAEEELELLNGFIDRKELPKVQFECERDEGDFKSCKFAKICKEAKWRKHL